MTKSFDIILVTDTPEHPKWFRGSGAHRIANHLRLAGFSCLVLDFSSALNFDTWKTSKSEQANQCWTKFRVKRCISIAYFRLVLICVIGWLFDNGSNILSV
jgi:hypothetical protein